MLTFNFRKFRVALLVSLTIFSMGMTTVPASAIDLGAKGRYIISVTPTARAAIEAAIAKNGGTVKNKYSYVFDGYTVELPKLVASLLAKIPNVLTVEEDAPVSGLNIQNNQSPTPSWGIDRIDQRVPVGANGSVSAYGYRSAGAGATIYIGDTGIYPHSDFGSRLSTSGYTSITDGNGTVDCNGHGTHVASTAAGTQYGVAKNATLVPVRILDCTGSGSYSGVIAGLDWILSPENPNAKSAAVLNLSIGGAKSTALNTAIQRLTNAGVVVVVAAGNENTDACTKSPASAPSAITVGATTLTDVKASYSNSGSCVDINAPGSSITGAWFGSPTATNTISGTSMATPHVTGAVAVYLGLKPNASVLEATNYIDTESTKDVLTGLAAGTPNKLLFVSPTDQGAPVVKPVVAMKSVSAITYQSATVNIDVNPGYAPTTLSFEYAIDSAFTTPIAVPVVPGSVDGGAATVASVSLTGLNALSTYYFRIIGVNESGRTVSEIGSFTTLAPPVTAPISRVSAPTNVTAYSATLNGVVQAGNAATKVSFVYGTSADFKTNTITTVGTPPDISGGTNFYNVTANVKFLDGGKTYYYKVVATNATGTTSSDVQSFVTPVAPGIAPVVVTDQSPFVAEVVTVTGSINPQGQTTSVRLVMGKEASLTVSPIYINVANSPFTGVDTVTVSAPSTTLAAGVRYYYAFEASNASGITRSPAKSNVFIRMPAIISNSIASLTTSSVVLSTVMNGGASNTRVSFIWGTDSTLTTGTTETNGTPFAVTSAIDTTVTAPLTGLKAATTYYARTKIMAYTGPLTGLAPLLGPIQTFTTSSIVAPTPTPGVKLAQTITFPALATRFFDAAGTPVLATASSGLAVTYTTTTPALCQILDLGSGRFTIQPVYPLTGADNVVCVLTANQPGNDKYAAAPAVSQTLTFTKQATKVVYKTSSPTVTEVGTFIYLNPQTTVGLVLGSTTPIAVTSLTPAVCTAGDYGIYNSDQGPRATVRAKANGTCSVKMDYPGNASQLASTATWTSTISGLTAPGVGSNTPQSITFPSIPDRDYGYSWKLQATATSKLPVKYTSLTPAVCQILEMLADGASVQSSYPLVNAETSVCIVQASQAGDDRYAAATVVQQSFKYRRAAMVITPYAVASSARNTARTPVAAKTYSAKSTYFFASSLLFASGENFGLLSIGNPMRASSTTPAVCTVASVVPLDNTGGIFQLATVNTLTSGTCNVVWNFDGTSDRAATSTTMSFPVK